MSTFEEIFLRTGMAPDAVAERLAEVLGMALNRDESGRVYVAEPLEDGAGTRVGGEVHVNGYADPDPDPEEVSVLDGYDTVYAVWSSDPANQQTQAEALFTRITELLPWPALLTHDANDLLAAWTPQLGRRDFEPPVSPDPDDKTAWADYQMPRVEK